METEFEKPKRVRLRDRTTESDIKYRGYLSYRHLRIIAWVCLIIAAMGTITKFNVKISPSSEPYVGWLVDVGNFFAALPLPLFLIANFAVILQKKNSWKQLLMFYGGVAALLYVVGNFVVIHYGYGMVKAFDSEANFLETSKGLASFLFDMGNTGYVFNIFIDLFLCSLAFFFANYVPKDGFATRKKLILFRLGILIPIVYEIVSIILKYLQGTIMIEMPHFVFLLLTSKPPILFLAIIALFILIRVDEKWQLHRGKDEEFVREHSNTNAHSLRVSIAASIVFVTAGLIDFIFRLVFVSYAEEVMDGNFDHMLRLVGLYSAGFGSGAVITLIAPLLLLFSYSKVHKNPGIDKYIPVVGVGLIIFVYIEGAYQIIATNVPILMEKIKNFFSE